MAELADYLPTYLERGLWRQLFKLIHINKERAFVVPSRYLVASCLLFEKVSYPATLGNLSRHFSSENIKGVNRVPYEVTEKKLLSFYSLDLDQFDQVIESFVDLNLLYEYDERDAYLPGFSVGSAPPLVVLEDGRIGSKQYIWEKTGKPYEEILRLFADSVRNDPDIIDTSLGDVSRIIEEGILKRLNFLDGCFRAALRDAALPIIRDMNILLPMIEDLFPKCSFSINVFRALVAELPQLLVSPMELCHMVNDSRLLALRNNFSALQRGGGCEDEDPYDLSEEFLGFVSDWISENKAKSEGRHEIELRDSWPSYFIDSIPAKESLAGTEKNKSSLMLILTKQIEGRLTCVGINNMFFEPY
jgi:hypothetical protein